MTFGRRFSSGTATSFKTNSEVTDARKENFPFISGAENPFIPFSIGVGISLFGLILIKGVKNVEEVSKLVKDQDSLWLILSFWKYGDPKGLIQDYINQHYYVVESKKFFDIDVYHYRKK